MRRKFLMALTVCVWLSGMADSMAADAEEGGPKLVLGLDAGWRQDDLHWDIASDPTGSLTPNVLSELRWKHVQSFQTALTAEAEDRHVVFRSRAAYGRIGKGLNEDSDYAGDNRTLEWSRSRNDASAGYTADVSGALGWRFEPAGAWSFVPLAGYAWHRQFLRMRNGYQVVSKVVTINGVTYQAPPLGPFTGLDSRYIANWHGPWLGVELDWHGAAWQARMTGRYEWNRYRGEANWNLRQDLAHPLSFLHRARGHGWHFQARVERRISEQLILGLDTGFSRFDTRAGTDTSYLSTGGTGGVTRLNGVHWRSASIGCRLEYDF